MLLYFPGWWKGLRALADVQTYPSVQLVTTDSLRVQARTVPWRWLFFRRPCCSGATNQASLSFLISAIFPKRHAPFSPPPRVSLISSSLPKPTLGKGVVFKLSIVLGKRQHRFLVSLWEWEREVKGRQNPLNMSIIHTSTDTPWRMLLPHVRQRFLPLTGKTQASSPSAEGRSNLLADVLWTRTMAANSVKRAECVQQEGGHDIRCLYSFRWERNRQGEAHLLLWVPFPEDAKDKSSSCTANNQAAETVPAGEDRGAEPHHPWWLH